MSDFYFKPGALVNINIINQSFTEDGFTTLCMCSNKNNCGYVYENIDLCSYPSSTDFKGRETLVKHGDTATVLKKVGRPFKISSSDNWNCYDIFEIMLETSDVRQIFRHNLKLVKEI